MKPKLTDAGFQSAATELGVEPAVIKAVCDVEAPRGGFLADGRVRILFERHKFHKFTGGIYSAKYPDISNPKPGGYGAEGAHQYARFSKAFGLDPKAAMKSASWGKFQIMGFNFASAGYPSIDAFVDAMKVSEDEQLKAFVNIIKSFALADELRSHDWAGFARGYNGANYKINSYDTKLAAAYRKHSANGHKSVGHSIAADIEPVEDETSEAVAEPDDDAPVVVKEIKPADAPKLPDSQVSTVQSNPPVIEMKPSGVSWTTKIAAGITPIGTALTALGIKIGNVEISTAGVIAMAAVFIVSVIAAAWIYNQGQERNMRRLELSMNNLADRDKLNVVAGGTTSG